MRSKRLPYTPIIKARYCRPLKASNISPLVLRMLRFISPFYLRFGLNFSSIELLDAERQTVNSLVSLWRDFQDGKTRLILAFRHPYGDEPQVFSYLFDVLLKNRARRDGVALRGHPHARFIHGYEVALWGGPLIRWLLPRIGAVPVYHVKADSAGIKAIRGIIRDGPHPIALAPEGQVSYRSETVPRLEAGCAQMGFWCAEELDKEGRNERVYILPLSIHHIFDPRNKKKVVNMIRSLEAACSMDTVDATLPDRLEALDLKVLAMAEDFYERTYGKRAKVDGHDAQSRDARWEALRHIALAEGERALGLTPHAAADEIQRVYRLRQECWDRIYSLDPARKISALERAYADRRAGEAWFAMRHMEFVDIAYYLDSDYLAGTAGDPPSFNRIAETVINLTDLVNRFAGGNISNRSAVLRKRAVVIAGKPIEIRERMSAYKDNRKQAVDAVTADMKQIFLDCATALRDKELNDEY
ncbi:MAG TPA: hypothetical protein P5286_07665 [Treponemataceae bacterium]|nr:hypothetical protein [Treponemataceae bacterium]